MRIRVGAPLLAAVAVLGGGRTAEAGHCGATAYPSNCPPVCDAQQGFAAYSQGQRPSYQVVHDSANACRFQTTYQTVTETVMKEVPCPVRRKVAETTYQCVTETVCKPVCETVMKECHYTVYKKVCETQYKACHYTVCKPVTEVHCHNETYQACQQVCETIVKHCPVTVCKPVTECVIKEC